MVQIQPQCTSCVHLYANQKGPNCEAFPAGIPMEILLNEFDCANAWPGDNGIRYEEGEPIGAEAFDSDEEDEA